MEKRNTANIRFDRKLKKYLLKTGRLKTVKRISAHEKQQRALFRMLPDEVIQTILEKCKSLHRK